MKREIKFRAWDKENKKLYSCDYLQFAMGGIRFLTLINDKQNVVDLKDDSFEIMQFTGLYDKNGKEIYEGDVYDIYKSFDANSTDAGQLKYSNCEVVFDAGCFCFKIPVFPEGRVNTPIYFESGRTWDYKGNIYENPELLKP